MIHFVTWRAPGSDRRPLLRLLTAPPIGDCHTQQVIGIRIVESSIVTASPSLSCECHQAPAEGLAAGGEAGPFRPEGRAQGGGIAANASGKAQRSIGNCYVEATGELSTLENFPSQRLAKAAVEDPPKLAGSEALRSALCDEPLLC